MSARTPSRQELLHLFDVPFSQVRMRTTRSPPRSVEVRHPTPQGANRSSDGGDIDIDIDLHGSRNPADNGDGNDVGKFSLKSATPTFPCHKSRAVTLIFP